MGMGMDRDMSGTCQEGWGRLGDCTEVIQEAGGVKFNDMQSCLMIRNPVSGRVPSGMHGRYSLRWNLTLNHSPAPYSWLGPWFRTRTRTRGSQNDPLGRGPGGPR